MQSSAHPLCRCISPLTNSSIFPGSENCRQHGQVFTWASISRPSDGWLSENGKGHPLYSLGMRFQPGRPGLGGSRGEGEAELCVCVYPAQPVGWSELSAERLVMRNQSFSHLANCPGPWLGGCNLHNHYPGTAACACPALAISPRSPNQGFA